MAEDPSERETKKVKAGMAKSVQLACSPLNIIRACQQGFRGGSDEGFLWRRLRFIWNRDWPLEFLDLLDNQLTGTLTSNISLLNELTKLSIGRNRISGSILAKILCRKQQSYGRNTQRTGSAYLSGDSKSKLQQPLWRL
ncbi:hypothetical protein Dimus_004071 [Dionaea muscipula]